MTTSALLFNDFKSSYDESVAANFTLAEYFDLCRSDPMTYGLAAERMVKAIGEPRLVATKSDPRLLRLFGNRTLKYYDAFADFYGMEGGIIEEIVAFYRHAAQGLEERKQVLYLLGPVGSAKSTLAIKPQESDGALPHLHVGGRRYRRAQPPARVALGIVQTPRSSVHGSKVNTALRRAISPDCRAPGRRSACIITTGT